ncbi:hypothetical protein IFT36_00115 [Frigoribacterium sp. CFBP 13605]|jgi:hypothetical protein|uniref:type IV toxin-antitoxin system AbiEi family antitoxin n=1 Tax=Frigoribacterium sp. CFBP 13605 TaxID=2774034 RepID=UPI001904936B|nr:hypothetical protein [Frigoribacterium sp. CFBP 13605]MBD8138948.1 hypothetical protein [Frigoribacterium sp. CFBP 13605]
MPARLPLVLTHDDLPEPELRAAALDGQVYAVGGSWRSVAEIDDAGGRAIAIGIALGAGVVAAERSAAWVWGARGPAPLPHSGLVVSPARVKHRGRGSIVRQVVIDEGEIVTVHGVAVTTPARTVVDLARCEGWASEDETAARDVASQQGVTYADAIAVLDRRGRLPHRTRTVERLDRVCPVVADAARADDEVRRDADAPGRSAEAASQPALTR